MCGIHGFITTKKLPANTNISWFLQQAFVANSIRGTDSSGLAVINAKRDIAIQKLPLQGSLFITDRYAQQLTTDASSANTISIGHVRSSTTGTDKGVSGAHPFYVDKEGNGIHELVGCHNGTLDQWKWRKGGSDFQVDSEWALNHIYDNGMKAFEDFNGAYCFVWWDSWEENVLNMALNDQRPMCIAFLEDGSMAYASEAGMLYWLLSRNNFKIKGNILRLAPNNWYKFNTTDPSAYSKEAIVAAKVSTVPFTREGTHSRRRGFWKTTDERMAEAMSGLGIKPDHKPLVLVEKPMVLKAELDLARDMKTMNEKGIFTPWYNDNATGELQGNFVLNNEIEYPAIMRNSADMEFGPNSEWQVTLIGLQDDGKVLTAVVSKPRMTIGGKPVVTLGDTAVTVN